MNAVKELINTIKSVLENTPYQYKQSPCIFDFEKVPRSKTSAYRIEINKDEKLRELSGGMIEKEAGTSIWLLKKIKLANRQEQYIDYMTEGIEQLEKQIYQVLKGQQIEIDNIESLDLYDEYIVVKMSLKFLYQKQVV